MLKLFNRNSSYGKFASRKMFSEDVSTIKEKLIKLSLMNVNKYGWTELAIKVAANELGYTHTISKVLENGPADLVYYTMDNWNKKLKQDVKEIDEDEK